MTALHHYWLHRASPVVPSMAPVWAWPCKPTILGTQGLLLPGPYTFSTRFIGGHTGGIYSGASTGEPCDHVIVSAIDGSSINPLVQMDSMPFTANWTVECRIGWSSALVPTSMDFIRVIGSPDVRVRYTPSTSALDLRVGGSVVATITESFAVNIFHHVAITCTEAGEYKVWVDGALKITYTGAPVSGTLSITCSTVFGSNRPIFLEGVRLWQDIAYSAAFTPPTSLTVP